MEAWVDLKLLPNGVVVSYLFKWFRKPNPHQQILQEGCWSSGAQVQSLADVGRLLQEGRVMAAHHAAVHYHAMPLHKPPLHW